MKVKKSEKSLIQNQKSILSLRKRKKKEKEAFCQQYHKLFWLSFPWGRSAASCIVYDVIGIIKHNVFISQLSSSWTWVPLVKYVFLRSRVHSVGNLLLKTWGELKNPRWWLQILTIYRGKLDILKSFQEDLAGASAHFCWYISRSRICASYL